MVTCLITRHPARRKRRTVRGATSLPRTFSSRTKITGCVTRVRARLPRPHAVLMLWLASRPRISAGTARVCVWVERWHLAGKVAIGWKSILFSTLPVSLRTSTTNRASTTKKWGACSGEGSLAPSSRAPHVHDQTREKCFQFFRPAAGAGRKNRPATTICKQHCRSQFGRCADAAHRPFGKKL